MTEDQIDRIRQHLAADLADHGVREVVNRGAFPKPGGWMFLLITETDEQHKGLKQSDPLLPEVLEVLRGYGVTEPQLSWISTQAISQEILDRCYEGSWFNWLR